MASLKSEVSGLEPGLVKVLLSISAAVGQIAVMLRNPQNEETGSTNTFGDTQLQADIKSDQIVFDQLRKSGMVATASSEEQSDMLALGGTGYSVAFDPLDGSSVITSNFAVGSIFGIWRGAELLGQRGSEQVAAAYSVYGSRTSLVVARPCAGSEARFTVQEFVLAEDGTWSLTHDGISVGEKKVFAPANLRATTDNEAYRDLVMAWMAQRYTLRYTGGMVPDVHHILSKGGGVFCSPVSTSAPAKLRLLYECAPLAFIVEAAGGASADGHASVLQRQITSSDIRTPVCLGSCSEVQKSILALQQTSSE